MSAHLIETARASSGLSQADLAVSAGTSRTTLNAYERGHKFPTASTLSRILDAAGFDLRLSRQIRFHSVPAPRGADYYVADHLWRLPPQDALRTVSLPTHLDWSSPSSSSFDLRDRHQRARCYEVVLREGRPDDILSIVDGCLLAETFSELHLPAPLAAARSHTIDTELR